MTPPTCQNGASTPPDGDMGYARTDVRSGVGAYPVGVGSRDTLRNPARILNASTDWTDEERDNHHEYGVSPRSVDLYATPEMRILHVCRCWVKSCTRRGWMIPAGR
jgi:hypothetical protein